MSVKVNKFFFGVSQNACLLFIWHRSREGGFATLHFPFQTVDLSSSGALLRSTQEEAAGVWGVVL